MTENLALAIAKEKHQDAANEALDTQLTLCAMILRLAGDTERAQALDDARDYGRAYKLLQEASRAARAQILPLEGTGQDSSGPRAVMGAVYILLRAIEKAGFLPDDETVQS